MDSIKAKLKILIEKIKNNRKAQLYLAIGVVAIIIGIFLLQSGIFSTKSKSDTSSTVVINDQDETDAIEKLEQKLSDILSDMAGVGKAKVVITVTGTTEKITANTTTTGSTNTQNPNGGSTTTINTTTSPIVVSTGGKSEPYVVKEVMPEIVGVLVVAKGAENSVIRLSIMRAVETALNVPANKVEIYAMK
ncbi:MAG: hypothetical protein IJ735_00255 [Clostridia bacterium]|nr:hypothetical protein [Clostridia bacterium]